MQSPWWTVDMSQCVKLASMTFPAVTDLNLDFSPLSCFSRGILKKTFVVIYLCLCIPAWVYVHHLCASVCGGQKGVSGPLGHGQL